MEVGSNTQQKRQQPFLFFIPFGLQWTSVYIQGEFQVKRDSYVRRWKKIVRAFIWSHMVNPTVGLSHLPVSIKVLKYHSYPTYRDASYMLVKICTKCIDHSFTFLGFFGNILTIMGDASLHVEWSWYFRYLINKRR